MKGALTLVWSYVCCLLLIALCGANAQTMANDVASPLEQQILGAENMIYMYSQNLLPDS